MTNKQIYPGASTIPIIARPLAANNPPSPLAGEGWGEGSIPGQKFARTGQVLRSNTILVSVFFLFSALLLFSFSPAGAWAAVPNGDLNGDGVVNAGDVMLAQRIAMGIVTATSDQLSRGDVAPLSAPDGVIDAGDVVVIQRIAMGSIKTYSITASAGANGTISPSGAVSVVSGATVTFIITPNTGYLVSDVFVDGVSKGAISSYAFNNATANHTIAASFAIDTYTITSSADANGMISPSGIVSVVSGATTTFTITPNTGYHVSDALVDGVSVGAVRSYTFTNVTANHTITAGFASNTYTITATANANGTIAPTGILSTNLGATATLTMNPNTGYHVADVLVDGASVGAVSSYTFTNVTADHTIDASFAINTYAITATADANGAISPTGAVSVNYGNTMTFNVTPNTDSTILDVIVDGVSVGNVSSYTFTNITANHSIFANFTVSNGNDDTNIYCMGTGTVLVGPSAFTNSISVPSSNNDVWIASPTNYSTITGSRTIIKGAMDDTIPVMGVVVQVINSSGTGTYPVAVNGKYFAAQVPLAADSNTIKVIATDQNNVQHLASITVTGIMQSNNVNLYASPSAGIPTLKQSGRTTLDVALTATASIANPISSYVWDFNGSGANQLTCYSHSNVTASYEQVGLYLTTVTVTDTEGNHYRDTVMVNVLDRIEMDNFFKQIWNEMKIKLGNQDIEGSISYFAEDSKEVYRQNFTRLSPCLPQMVAEMGELRIVKITDGLAECDLRTIRNGEIYSFQILFMIDQDGVWRIRSF